MGGNGVKSAVKGVKRGLSLTLELFFDRLAPCLGR